MSDLNPRAKQRSTETTKALEKLVARARAVLKHNDSGTYTIPSKGLYPHQVLWDSCFVAIGRSHYDPERAKLEITRLLDSQWSNGMIPHIIFNNEARFWWDRQIWRSWVSSLSVKGLATSGISQPPMLAEAIVRIGQQLTVPKRIVWYQSVFPQLVAYHLWFYKERDPRREGLVVQLHPWETGLDTSPPCMEVLHTRSWPSWLNILDNPLIGKIGNRLRVDTKFVAEGERASNAEAVALYILLRRLRRRKYDSSAILQDPYFAVQDITYNCILTRANKLLSEISEAINQKIPQELQRHIAKTTNVLDGLWDKDSSAYYSREFTSNKLIKDLSIGSLMPLYAGTISHQRAEALVKQIEDKTSFGLKYPLPSVPANSAWFSPDRYWQGPTWVNANWLIIDGLERYGFDKQAKALAGATLNLVKQSGFYEYFDPYLGTPHGTNNFSWTAALTIDLVYRTYAAK